MVGAYWYHFGALPTVPSNCTTERQIIYTYLRGFEATRLISWCDILAVNRLRQGIDATRTAVRGVTPAMQAELSGGLPGCDTVSAGHV